jgi:hypothetical protein
MFFPKIAMVQTKAPESPNRNLAPQPSTLVERPFGGGAVEQARALQRTIGNQATLPCLTQRLSNLPAKGPAEQHEQGTASENVTSGGAPHGASRDFSMIPVFAPDRANRPQVRSALSAPRLSGIIQPKLVVGEINDPRAGGGSRPRSAQMDDLHPIVPNAEAASRWDTVGGHRVPDLQRTMGNAGVAAALRDEEQSPVHEVIGSGGGRPLEPEVRADMKARLGHDFSHVRIHDDSRAHEAATAVNAHAYTVGSDIVFQRGGYNPATPEGKLTLAHELTHVVQQSQGPVDGTEAPGGIRISDPGDRFEREAAANAERAVSTPAPAAPSTAGSVADVQRDPISRWHSTDRSPSERPPETVARRTRAPDSGGLRRGPRGLQGMIGNQATAAVLQRQPSKPTPKPKPKPKAPPEPVIDDATASRDYTDAENYVGRFYAGVHFALELKDKVGLAAQANYKDYSELKDPPSLGEEIFKALAGVVMSKIPGWSLIQTGLEVGMFASELGKLKLELDEYPIPGKTVEDVEKEGPSAATKEKAKKHIEHAKTGWEGASKVYETVVDVFAKQKEAKEAGAKALESAGIRQERITDWAQATAVAQKEENSVIEWVQQAARNKKMRGRMNEAVQMRLGPILIIDPKQVEILTKKYELKLYQMHYSATGRYEHTFWIGMGDRIPAGAELRVSDGLALKTRQRIAWCADVSGTDDETMVTVLGIPSTYKYERLPGLRIPGEV